MDNDSLGYTPRTEGVSRHYRVLAVPSFSGTVERVPGDWVTRVRRKADPRKVGEGLGSTEVRRGRCTRDP